MPKILTFIGNGNMALSLAQGLKKDYTIEVVGRDMLRLEAFEEALGLTCKKYFLEDFDISQRNIIFCVKPANVEEVGKKLQGSAEVLYSVLAGTSLKKLSQNIQASHYIRTMPNLGASVLKSMTTLTGSLTCKQEALDIFNAIGASLWVNSEKELDIATALAGSGPAYLALIAEALADGAVKQGLKREDALTLMRGLFDGFASLIQDIHPALLKDAVMSPGGTTATGYGALEKASVRNGVMNAVEEAYKRTFSL